LNDAFVFWKTVHILSAAVLFGTGLGIAFFCWLGYRSAIRSGDIGSLRSSLRLTVIADAWLTAPAVVIQAVTGSILMSVLGWPLTGKWSVAVWALFLSVGACWLPVVVIQIRLKRTADEAVSVAGLPASFHSSFRWWFALGIPAFTLILILFYFMVAKPFLIA
jgi:uncharacterized membrane protein